MLVEIHHTGSTDGNQNISPEILSVAIWTFLGQYYQWHQHIISCWFLRSFLKTYRRLMLRKCCHVIGLPIRVHFLVDCLPLTSRLELDRFLVLKIKKFVQLLSHIFEQTQPSSANGSYFSNENSPTSVNPLRLATAIIFIACLSLDTGILGSNSSIAPTPTIQFNFSKCFEKQKF